MIICLDAGHGGFEPGAVGPNRTKEKDITLQIVLKLGQLLVKQGHRVIYTRFNDNGLGNNTSTSLASRANIANKNNADVFISIHCNSGSPKAQGMEIYTSPGKTKADTLATLIVKEWEAVFKTPAVRKDLQDGDPDKEARYYVLMHTKMPAVLLEVDFISNPDREKLLKDPAFQQKVVEIIAKAISKY